MKEEKISIKTIILFAMFLSGAITFIVFIISSVAELFLRDPLSFEGETPYLPSRPLVKMLCYLLFIAFFFIYIPLKSRVQEQTISRKSGIVMVTVLTYLLSSVSLALFLSFTTEMVEYEFLAENNTDTKKLLEEGVSCTFDFRESFFDAVSGFTTTGLTAFKKTNVKGEDGREISKVDTQPNLIHIIRATYLWIGGLGIMFFYLYFTPVPSLMMSMGYEIPAERSLPKFIRLEGLSFTMVYCIITALGILLLFLFISSTFELNTDDGTQPEDTKIATADNRNVMTYSVVLAFSSISTGGFSPGSDPVDEIEIERPFKDGEDGKLGHCRIDYWGLVVIMVLMFLGAMPIFSMHRPLKFFRRWKIFAVFLLPVILAAVFSYIDPEHGPEVSLYRSFDTLSAFTTTGLFTTQFEKDFETPSRAVYRSEYGRVEYISEYEKGKYISKHEKIEYAVESKKTVYEVGNEEKKVREIHEYQKRNIYIIVLMFIGGAAYSTAGGWGFFSFWCIISAAYLIMTGKLERVLTKYIIGLILSFVIFFSLFAIGTALCYKSGLFGTISAPEPEAVTDYVISSAFYEISALSTVGLMPDYMVSNEDIYDNNLAYWTLAISMLVGRLYFIIFPLIVSLITPEGGI